ncbi:hypothetical protein C8Q72DRAFT_452519 [Fomitopsis betulina]|nr:hypothetical protein C8Q72DRAFT_452519 [Fomitopsis betulina]
MVSSRKEEGIIHNTHRRSVARWSLRCLAVASLGGGERSSRCHDCLDRGKAIQPSLISEDLQRLELSRGSCSGWNMDDSIVNHITCRALVFPALEEAHQFQPSWATKGDRLCDLQQCTCYDSSNFSIAPRAETFRCWQAVDVDGLPALVVNSVSKDVSNDALEWTRAPTFCPWSYRHRLLGARRRQRKESGVPATHDELLRLPRMFDADEGWR